MSALVAHTAVAVAQPAATLEQAAASVIAAKGSGETRALLVARDGQLKVEHYGRGYTAENRFISWSMAKSVTAMVIGMFVDEGKLQLDAPAPVAAWRTLTDGREKITLRHLLNMTSGLQHQEGGEGGKPIQNADTVRMLFTDGAQSAAAYAISRPLAYPPGTHWQYSTATTHVLADIATNLITSAKDPAERRRVVADWFSMRLWQPLGITTAEWDFDNAGLFLGGSMLHMTARDYLKLGQFMLDRGKAPDGKRLVSDAWIDVMLTKAPAANTNQYAGQVWINIAAAADRSSNMFHPKGTPDTFNFGGHLGQYITVVPPKRLVVVRLGKSVGDERRVIREALGDLLDAGR